MLVRHIPSKNCAVTNSIKNCTSVSLFLTENVIILFDSPPRSRPTKKFLPSFTSAFVTFGMFFIKYVFPTFAHCVQSRKKYSTFTFS
ncbi:hypothetical protein AX774_g4039 [Zancudomyces culisetae]|uniref:Uncharacterized protein n=1 Tax=Zancudomyces culisetae TaxID=1213189 RepID=A0A1R1PNE1_ZANCU|nr:hypothetical protein AX774_g4039 [Zancudomyces culisetae]|eukprot:OMH82479.1 hypothetical protein AX774_g4039 [Zancudomyces culisetae]